MTIFLIICTVFPNALNLRPTVFPRDNVFTDMVKVLYKTDTPTNVLPSIHVFNSIGVSIAISHSNDLKKHRWIQISAYILAVLIILSTMFLKQHSVTDVIAAVTMACIIYPFVYVTADKKRRSFLSSRRNMNIEMTSYWQFFVYYATKRKMQVTVI